MPRFAMNFALEAMPGVPPDQIDECKGEQQGQRTGANDQRKQNAQVRLEPGVALRHRIALGLQKSLHLGANRVHQTPVLTAARKCQHAGRVVVAAQLDHPRQFRQLGVNQRRQCVQVPDGSTDRGKATQFLEPAADAVPHRHIGLEEVLVASQRKTALAGLGVRHCGQQIVRASDHNQ